jgi:hypothetical protein
MSYIKVVTLKEFHGIFLLKKEKQISISVLPWFVKKKIQTEDNFSQNQNLKKING